MKNSHGKSEDDENPRMKKSEEGKSEDKNSLVDFQTVITQPSMMSDGQVRYHWKAQRLYSKMACHV